MGERAIETNDVNSSSDRVTRVPSLTSCRNSLVGDKVSPLSLNQPYSRVNPWAWPSIVKTLFFTPLRPLDQCETTGFNVDVILNDTGTTSFDLSRLLYLGHEVSKLRDHEVATAAS
jgi:hypothetical protein